MFPSTQSIAIYMEGSLESDHGKMGFGLMRYSSNPIPCVIDTKFAGKTVRQATGLPFDIPIVSTVEEAHRLGADILVLGIAPSGGQFPPSWDEPMRKALRMGMSLINGLHDQLNERYSDMLEALKPNQKIWDVRVPTFKPEIGTAKAAALSNKRVLMVGTDMAVGKMTAGLEVHRFLKKNGYSSGFLATGQIGICIMGKGIPLDAFKVDQACGAVEQLVLDAKDKDIVIVEGQGSLLNPGSTATLPLMRGACPTHMILVHRADMSEVRHGASVPVPPLKEFIALNEAVASCCGSLTPAKTVGIALNTFGLPETRARAEIHRLQLETGLPVTDVIRYGPEKLAKAILM